MSADLQISPDVVDGLARLARRVAAELDDGSPDGPGDDTDTLVTQMHRATEELLAFAGAAESAARRARDADGAARRAVGRV